MKRTSLAVTFSLTAISGPRFSWAAVAARHTTEPRPRAAVQEAVRQHPSGMQFRRLPRVPWRSRCSGSLLIAGATHHHPPGVANAGDLFGYVRAEALGARRSQRAGRRCALCRDRCDDLHAARSLAVASRRQIASRLAEGNKGAHSEPCEASLLISKRPSKRLTAPSKMKSGWWVRRPWRYLTKPSLRLGGDPGGSIRSARRAGPDW